MTKHTEQRQSMITEFPKFVVKYLEKGRTLASLTYEELLKEGLGFKMTKTSFAQYKRALRAGYPHGPQLTPEQRVQFHKQIQVSCSATELEKESRTKKELKKAKDSKPLKASKIKVHVPVPADRILPFTVSTVGEYVLSCTAKGVVPYYEHFCQEHNLSENPKDQLMYFSMRDKCCVNTTRPTLDEKKLMVSGLLKNFPNITNSQVLSRIKAYMDARVLADVRESLKNQSRDPLVSRRDQIEDLLRKNPKMGAAQVRKKLGFRIDPSYVRKVVRDLTNAPSAVSGSYKVLHCESSVTLAAVSSMLETISKDSGHIYELAVMTYPTERIELRKKT